VNDNLTFTLSPIEVCWRRAILRMDYVRRRRKRGRVARRGVPQDCKSDWRLRDEPVQAGWQTVSARTQWSQTGSDQWSATKQPGDVYSDQLSWVASSRLMVVWS